MADEKRERAAGVPAAEAAAGALAGVPLALPALTRALKLQEKAGKVGFDWNDPRAVLAKLREEIDEVEAELEANDAQRVAGEVGDLLFAVANLARKLDVDAESALRAANLKFERRFHGMERLAAARGERFETLDLAAQEALWQAVKRGE
jgi:ATP diphosphatase